jgi:hypothetical protein
MPRRSRPSVNFHQARFRQISESHCGPAVVQMLLSNLDIEVSQEAVAEAGGATGLIELHGMRVDQLGLAVARLAPQVVFYFKAHATLAELVTVVNHYRFPVGVEWQGLFEDAEEEDQTVDAAPQTTAAGELLAPDSESEDEDYGHYSVVIHADLRKKHLLIADPYKDYFERARVFRLDEFEARWYDYNEVVDPLSGEPLLVEDYHMMFLVTPRKVMFPRRLNFHTL